jgi:ribosome-interacting GTPase 1
MNKLYYILFILILSSCDKSHELNRIETYSSNIISSSTSIEERRALEELWEYIFKNRMYVEIFAIASDGNVSEINELEDLGGVVNVRVDLSKNSQEHSLEWKPINLNNVFILFREK